MAEYWWFIRTENGRDVWHGQLWFGNDVTSADVWTGDVAEAAPTSDVTLGDVHRHDGFMIAIAGFVLTTTLSVALACITWMCVANAHHVTAVGLMPLIPAAFAMRVAQEPYEDLRSRWPRWWFQWRAQRLIRSVRNDRARGR